MKFDKKMIWIQILALIGLGLTIKLAMIYHAANFDKYALSSFCSINDFIDCDGAARTKSAQFIGLPLAWWGIFFYIITLFLTLVDKLKNIKFLKFLEVFKNPYAYISTLGTIAFTCSMILAGISLFGINKLCILCFATYFIDLAIALIASGAKFKSFFKNFKFTIFTIVFIILITSFDLLINTGNKAEETRIVIFNLPLFYWGVLIFAIYKLIDFFKSIKFLSLNIILQILVILAGANLLKPNLFCFAGVLAYLISLLVKNNSSNFKTTFLDFIDGAKKYTKTFIVLLILFVSFLAYSGITLNFVPHIKRHNSIMKYRKIKHNPYRINGNVLGNEKADVIIELYSDYVCPLCYINNIMLHQVVKEFNNIKVIHHNLPFDKVCNPYIDMNMHPGACYMSRAAIAARNQGDYWGMSSLLYEKQPKKFADMIELAKELNFDINKFKEDINSSATIYEINKEIYDSNRLGIDATPTMFVNGEKVLGVKPYYELKEILIKHGAKRK